MLPLWDDGTVRSNHQSGGGALTKYAVFSNIYGKEKGMNKAYQKARKMAEKSRQARDEWENDYKDRVNKFKKRITRKPL